MLDFDGPSLIRSCAFHQAGQEQPFCAVTRSHTSRCPLIGVKPLSLSRITPHCSQVICSDWLPFGYEGKDRNTSLLKFVCLYLNDSSLSAAVNNHWDNVCVARQQWQYRCECHRVDIDTTVILIANILINQNFLLISERNLCIHNVLYT